MKIELDESIKAWSKYAKIYDPIKCASIDGTDCEPHDRAVIRALNSTYRPNRFVKGRPECTIFVSRLNHETSKDTIKDIFSKYGKIKRFRMVKDIVTGMPKGYAFVEYEEEQGAEEAYRLANKMVVDGNAIFVDFECERLLKEWKPRRLGGGFAGKKESGQLRFGGRDRPFKKPIALELKEQDDRRQKERRRKEDDRRLRDKSRDRHKRRTPPRENGNSSPFRHNLSSSKSKTNKRGLSPKEKGENDSPAQKVFRHHSPTKQTDKITKLSHREKNDNDSKDKQTNSPGRKRERKNSPMQDVKQHSSRQENVKLHTSSSENTKQASSNKESSTHKPSKDNYCPKENTANSKLIPNDRSTLAKFERGRSPMKQQRPRRSPKQNDLHQSSLERPNKRSPVRVKNRRRSPFQKSIKRSPQRETDKKRPIIREKHRSRSPPLRSEELNSPSRQDDRRMYTGRHESPSRKLLKYPSERNSDRRPSFGQNEGGRFHAGRRLSPSYARQRLPPRSHHSPNRRSPLESFNRHYSPRQDLVPGQSSVSHPERIRSPISHYARDNRESSPANNRSKRSPREYLPRDHRFSSPRYEDKMHYSTYSDSHENQDHLSYHPAYTDNLKTTDYLPAQRDFKQYSPKLDFREPLPTHKPMREYSNFEQNNDNMARAFSSARNYPRAEDYSRNIDSLEDTRSSRAAYAFRDNNHSPRASYNPISNTLDLYPENANYLPSSSYQNGRQQRDGVSRYESEHFRDNMADARNFPPSRNDDNSRFESERGRLRTDRGGFGQF